MAGASDPKHLISPHLPVCPSQAFHIHLALGLSYFRITARCIQNTQAYSLRNFTDLRNFCNRYMAWLRISEFSLGFLLSHASSPCPCSSGVARFRYTANILCCIRFVMTTSALFARAYIRSAITDVGPVLTSCAVI